MSIIPACKRFKHAAEMRLEMHGEWTQASYQKVSSAETAIPAVGCSLEFTKEWMAKLQWGLSTHKFLPDSRKLISSILGHNSWAVTTVLLWSLSLETTHPTRVNQVDKTLRNKHCLGCCATHHCGREIQGSTGVAGMPHVSLQAEINVANFTTLHSGLQAKHVPTWSSFLYLLDLAFSPVLEVRLWVTFEGGDCAGTQFTWLTARVASYRLQQRVSLSQ